MKRLLAVLSILGICSTSYALEFQPIGARQLGMGGVGVASTFDATAQYYNPAIFGFYGKEGKETLEKKRFGINAQIGAGIRLNNDLGETIDELAKIDYDALSNIASNSSNLTRNDFENAVKLLSYLTKIRDKGGALTLNGNAAVASRIKRFGIGIYGLVEASGKPNLDLVNVGFTNSTNSTTVKNAIVNATDDGSGSSSITSTAQNYFGSSTISTLQSALQSAGFSSDQAIDIINTAASQLSSSGIPSTYVSDAINLVSDSVNASVNGNTIDKNQSSIDVIGIGLLEVPITYGHPVNDTLAFGVNLKLIKGRVYEEKITIFNNNSSDIVDRIKDKYEESNNFAVDLGAIYMPNNWIKIGAVAKYLNSPKFDRPNGGDYKVKPQGRLGIAINPFETLTIAADADVTKNETAVDGYKSQNIGVGLEWDVLKFLALRAGVYRNIAESDIGNMYTAGLGLNLYLIRADLGVAISGKKSSYDDKDYPNEARLQANISIEF
ncbi:MAG: conjugal transfer protein TraF [Calditerrivibrio sp.]|uniref:conjugal transfer protein TraF n=1 Tax=Calditerrivibrio sp. TaxID=2792612 RepID=UPI003D11034C